MQHELQQRFTGRLTSCGYGWLFCFLVASAPSASATQVSGRFSFGFYASQENFSDDSQGDNNDFMTTSERMYLKIQKWGPFDAIFDLRDTHDFFDKLDAERTHLIGTDFFQFREADIRYPNQNGSFYAAVGRFSIMDAGSAWVDGAEIGERFGHGWRFGIFGGHDPKRPEDIYMRSDTPDVDYGTYVSYQNPSPSWQHLFNTSLAYFENSVNGFVDRRYAFSNLLYQWNYASRLISNIYLDMVPRTFIQNGNVTYQQGISKDFDTSATLTAWDSITYSNQTGVLDQLPSSPYREASVRARYRLSEKTRWLNELNYGQRLADQTELKEAKTGAQVVGIFSPKIEMTGYLGYLEEFVARGPMGYFEIDYFSRQWEFGFNVNASAQQRFDDYGGTPSTLNPVTTELNIARIISNSFLATAALQYAHDEIATIYSGFLTVTYRFGGKDLAPIRDGAAPRRRL
jgi:hypothetical protein